MQRPILILIMTRIFLSLSSLMGQDPTRFESDIKAFEQSDHTSVAADHSVLFVGSSSIRLWSNLTSSFPNFPVLNRGFGGSTMPDLLYYFDRLVVPYKPSLVVVYEGDNDLAGGRTVEEVSADYATFIQRMKSQLPGSSFAFMSVKPSPARRHLLEEMKQLNQRLSELAEVNGGYYFDIYTPMVDEAGQPYPQLFLSDRLHMNSGGYRLWRVTLTPMLDQWAQDHAANQQFSSYEIEKGMLRLKWELGRMLETSENLSGPWTTLPTEEPGYHQEKITRPKRFYRLR